MKHRAFTLVEIMIVILIISILLAMALPNFMTSRENSRAKACITNLQEIDQAKETWATEMKESDTAVPQSTDLVPTYMNVFPICPSSGTYAINAVGADATCSYTSGPYPHVLNSQ